MGFAAGDPQHEPERRAGGGGKPLGKRRTGRISYAHLGINQLGAVYEALLSYRGFFAKEDLYEVRPAGDKGGDEFEVGYFVTASELDRYSDDEKVCVRDANGERVLKKYAKETFIYRPTGRARTKSASYYTPEILTQSVVKHALGEFRKTNLDSLPDDRARAERIRTLKICEPAMGSAAFLNEAVNQLAALYMTYAQRAAGERLSQEDYARECQRVKMYLADNCVYGVDLNPVAVELAEVSLWLNALSSDRFVPWFGLQLQSGNSLIGCQRSVYRLSDLTGKAKWSEAQPRDIGPNPLGEKEIWHFLVPDAGMADYKDADMKALFPDAMATLAAKRKDFVKGKFTTDELSRMMELSHRAEKLWQSWAKKLRDVRLRTTDPYEIYGYKPEVVSEALSYEEKEALAASIRFTLGKVESAEYQRLSKAMNYWCALWFWPIEKAELFPSREAFLADMELILTSDVLETAEGPAADLFTQSEGIAEDSEGNVGLESLSESLKVANETAKRLNFFHWPLGFADVFLPQAGEKPGFDLTFGNPPWRVPKWEAGEVVGDFIPYVLFRGTDASDIRKTLLVADADGTRLFDRYAGLSEAFTGEFSEATGTKSFLGAAGLYPELQGSRTDLFKAFLPLSWRNAAVRGVQGFLHPLTSMTETNGEMLRRASYERLRLWIQIWNRKLLFADIRPTRTYAVSVYGSELEEPAFTALMGVLHPKEIALCLDAKDDEDAAARVLRIDGEALDAIGAVCADKTGAPPLPMLASQSELAILKRFTRMPMRIGDLKGQVLMTMMWNETTSRNDGTIRLFPGKAARRPDAGEPAVLNGPHIGVGNPLYQTMKPVADTNQAFLPLDLETIPDDFMPRAKYAKACSREVYAARQPKCAWDGLPADAYWRLFHREFVDLTVARTLTSALMPPGVGHIDAIHSLAFESIDDMLSSASAFASLPMDAFVRALGKPNLKSNLIKSLPLVNYGARQVEAFARVLALNCLTIPYGELWSLEFDERFRAVTWSQTHEGLDADFWSKLTPEWQRNCALRSDLARRQALVEIDVLTAQVTGLTLHELLSLYRSRFSVLRKYEEGTYYDVRGRIVFSPMAGGPGLPRKARPKDAAAGITYAVNGVPAGDRGLGFEEIRDMTEGFVEKTFPDASLTDDPVMRTVRYEAPFFKMDREKDYETAWAFFEAKYGPVEIVSAVSKTAPEASSEGKSSADARPVLELRSEPFDEEPNLFTLD